MSHPDKPASGEPAIDKPAIDKPAADKPVVDKLRPNERLADTVVADGPTAAMPPVDDLHVDTPPATGSGIATPAPASARTVRSAIATPASVSAPAVRSGIATPASVSAPAVRSAIATPASAPASAPAATLADVVVVPFAPADRFARIELHPHDPAWAGKARAEIARLTAALGDAVVCIEHIGSTSIPHIAAKPIIDLLPLVSSLAAVDARANDVIALGYDWRGEYGIPGRRFCTRTDPATGRRLFNVHIFASDSPDTARHVAFRDYLRAHPAEARAYEAEKQRAAALHPSDVFAYNDEKNDWIKACERRALAWWPPRRACAEK